MLGDLQTKPAALEARQPIGTKKKGHHRAKTVALVSTFVILLAFAAPELFADEILLKTNEAKQWEADNPNRQLAKLKSVQPRLAELQQQGYSVTEDNGVIVLRIGWSHKGVEAKPAIQRDQFAAQALKDQAERFMSDWNKGFGVPTKKFAGVHYLRSEGSWSDTEGPTLWNGNRRKYKAGGTAVGYILVDPY